MRSLLEELEADLPQLEAEFGSDSLYVKDLKEQVRASKANAGKSARDVYRMAAYRFPKASASAEQGPPLDLQNLPFDPAEVAMLEGGLLKKQ